MKVLKIHMVSGNVFTFTCSDAIIERIGAKITKIQIIGCTDREELRFIDYNKIEAIFTYSI